MSESTKWQPAFPYPVSLRDDGAILEDPHRGMTLRQYYIGQALAGAATRFKDIQCPKDRLADFSNWQSENMASIAKGCIMYADAVIAALDKEKME